MMKLRTAFSLWMALAIVGAEFSTTIGQVPRTRPADGLRDHTPATFAYVGAKLILAPGRIIPDGTIVVRDRIIWKIGPRREVQLPPGTRVLDGRGKTIYPAFLDAYDAVEATEITSGQPYWNRHVQPQRRMAAQFTVDRKRHEALRRAGIAARLVVPKSGVVQGTSVLVATTDDPLVLEPDIALHMRLTVERGRGSDEYPGSPMGAVALARQACYDARWYAEAWKVYRADPRVGRPETNDALAALGPWLNRDGLVIFDCPNERYVLRADRFAREFGIRAAFLGSGREYRRLDAVARTGRPVIVPLAFPKPPDVGTPQAAREATLQALMHWHLAPENPARLTQAGVKLAVTTWGIEPGELRSRVREAVERGWDADAALEALTIGAARILGVDRQVGSLEPGKLANLLVTDGDWFDKETRLLETWVAGQRYLWEKKPTWDPRGRWKLTSARGTWRLKVEGKLEHLRGSISRTPRPHSDSEDDTRLSLAKISFAGDRLALAFDGRRWNYEGVVSISLLGVRKPKGDVEATGTIVWPEGRATVRAVRTEGTTPEASEANRKKAEKDQETTGKDESESAAEKTSAPSLPPLEVPVNYPLGAFGRAAPPPQPKWVLFRGATVWTCGPDGTLPDTDVLVQRGRIVRVGRQLEAPRGALVIDLRGKHLTPGIVDCHSHMATDGGVNEATQAVTAEVRIGDFINADDIAIYRQLAGGVTTANILHGSANPIGGQNQVIKLRWGLLGEELKFAEAPPGIKFALGENVKQSNWGDDYTTRYPQTRMGVEQIIRDALQEAQLYLRRQRDWEQTHRGLPPRRDLELEALAEILQHRRWIHCHAYRQDEIVALLRTLERFQVRIGTLQHILEGYKVAEVMKRHGAMASAFSDWWAYKFEVYDAIPYNGALMHQAGIVVSFNSDDREMARHLNHEAAKAVKYGGVSPEDALRFVTLNPAKQLRIDRWVGSIEAGKHADLVVWSGPPLSTLSRCEQTWIDGRKYFDRSEDLRRREDFEQLKQALIHRVLASGADMLKPGETNATRDRRWPSHDIYCHCHDRGDQQP